jgi:HSP20 family molecular chaperone IbpA
MNDNTSLTRTSQDGAVRSQGASKAQAQRPALVPPVDIVESDAGIMLWADMPGVSKERVNVRVDGENLVLEGEAEVRVPEKLEILHSEIRHPFFRRVFTLSRELDTSRIEATVKDGVLRLHIPKAEEARPRRIEVNVG